MGNDIRLAARHIAALRIDAIRLVALRLPSLLDYLHSSVRLTIFMNTACRPRLYHSNRRGLKYHEWSFVMRHILQPYHG
jgi:hypothetical protein